MSMRTSTTVMILVALAISLTGGCETIDGRGDWIRGNGIPGTEVREMNAFDHVDIRNAFGATIRVEQDGRATLVVSADENLLPYIETYVEGTTLVVDIDGNTFGESPLRVDIRTPTLVGARATNAVALQVTGIDTKAFEVEASNSSTASLAGRVDDLDAKALNASAITADDLTAQSAFAEALNASSLALCATGDVAGAALNSSHIAIHCDPEAADISTDESSSLDVE